MKKLLSVFCIFFWGTMLFAFGGKAEDTKTSIVGHVKFFGNVPFEFAGFETVDGLLYTIQVADDSKIKLKEIESAQGYLLELTGDISKDNENIVEVLKDGVFIVSEWKKL